MMTWFLGLATLFVGIGVSSNLNHYGPTTWPGIVLFGILLVATLVSYWLESKYDND